MPVPRLSKLVYDVDLTRLTIDDYAKAMESAVKAAVAGRQNMKNIAPLLEKARPAFLRRVRAIAKRKNG